MKKTIIFSICFLFILTIPFNSFAEKKEKKLTNNAIMALQQARELQEKNEIEKALKLLSRFVNKNKKDDHHYIEYLIGSLYLEAGKLESALPAFEKSIELNENFVPSWQNLGKTAYDMKKYKKAAFALEKAYTLSEKKDKNILFAAAMANRNAENNKKAFELLNIVTQSPCKNKNHVNAYVHLGIKLKKHDQVIQRLNILIDENKNSSFLLKLAANTALSKNDYKGGVNYLTIYSMMTKTSFKEDKLTGDLYRALKAPYKAVVFYEKALEKKEKLKVYKALVSSLIEAGLYDKGLEKVNQGLKKYPKCHALWKLKAFIHYENENFEKAYSAVSKAVELKAKDKNTTILLAYCAGKTGKIKDAKAILSRIKTQKYCKNALRILDGFEQMEN